MEMVKINPVFMKQIAFESSLSPFACSHCGTHSSKVMEIQMRYAHNAVYKSAPFLCTCGKEMSVADSVLTILPSSAHLLDDGTTKTATWFHATNIYNWLEEVNYTDEDEENRPYVHLGSKEAALELAKWKYLEDPDDEHDAFYLWQVTLNPEVVLSEQLLADENDWFYEVNENARRTLGGDAVRYLNKWESAGSISLLADPRYLTAVRVDDVTIDNYFDFLEGMKPMTI